MSVDLNGLDAFVRVAHSRSFRKAAAGMGVSPSALSHAIGKLEQELGVRLLNRTTRSVSPSPAGARLLARLQPALADVAAALDALNDERTMPRGRLRLNVPRPAAQLVLAPLLARWRAHCPDVALDIMASDAVVDIVEQGFDAGMRFGELLQQDMVAVPVGPDIRFAVCATPDYLARHGVPATPHALAAHECLQLRFPSGALYKWQFQHDGQPLEVATNGSLALDDLPALLQAALDGAGLCYTYEAYAAPWVAQGRLAYVLQDWAPPAERFYLYYPSGRHMSAALRALVDFMKANGP
ncbi:LysR family transcriptional regulator [Duganella sp. FT92W]|uniref:LysR family transcriptional regulator n=1 Tax=Pseudoduganella rivuli TaxID=2666085 RepID=A0A7X2IN85_9BURK|nr:LysR family transcriptional regulator [Pseudoduganella rivuli]MRV72853.1 LysR family transcriptional regulator [Pseudoduganella rivuli]